MQASIGEIIRQVRHLRNMTQRELAGDRFSKSYVSAVERNRIAPSARALRFFAERLGEPKGNFAALLQQPDVAQALSALDTPALPVANGQTTRDDTITLLNMLLAEADFAGLAFDRHVPTLTREALASLPQQVQARYYFLLGVDAKERGQLAVALRAFESALALAPAHPRIIHRPLGIIDGQSTVVAVPPAGRVQSYCPKPRVADHQARGWPSQSPRQPGSFD